MVRHNSVSDTSQMVYIRLPVMLNIRSSIYIYASSSRGICRDCVVGYTTGMGIYLLKNNEVQIHFPISVGRGSIPLPGSTLSFPGDNSFIASVGDRHTPTGCSSLKIGNIFSVLKLELYFILGRGVMVSTADSKSVAVCRRMTGFDSQRPCQARNI